MKSWLDRTLSLILTVSVAGMAASLMYRQFVGVRGSATIERDAPAPTHYSRWKDLLQVGMLQGSADAPIKIVEFADLQCPSCRQFHTILKNIRRKFRSDVATVCPLSSSVSPFGSTRSTCS